MNYLMDFVLNGSVRADDDPESLLGVLVAPSYDSESAWSLMIEKLADSIKHWTAQNLSSLDAFTQLEATLVVSLGILLR
jgi:hypothetical protein